MVSLAASSRPDGAAVDLWLSVEADGVALDYDADLFDCDTAERLLCHVCTLLAAGLDDRVHDYGTIPGRRVRVNDAFCVLGLRSLGPLLEPLAAPPPVARLLDDFCATTN